MIIFTVSVVIYIVYTNYRYLATLKAKHHEIYDFGTYYDSNGMHDA